MERRLILRLLILGGTTEASRLARALAAEPGVAPLLSLAGATKSPAPAPIPQRIGGFGGAEGLADFLRAEQIGALIDATHPFAERMSAHALGAAHMTGTPLLVFTRPPWTLQAGDVWREVESMDEASEALGARRRVVFLTQGRLRLAAFARAPQHRYVVRAIDPPAEIEQLPEHRLILARGPFALADETQLMRDEGIEVLVTKNSGGAATYPKIEAARALGVEVVIVSRPQAPDAPTAFSLDEAMAWVRARI